MCMGGSKGNVNVHEAVLRTQISGGGPDRNTNVLGNSDGDTFLQGDY